MMGHRRRQAAPEADRSRGSHIQNDRLQRFHWSRVMPIQIPRDLLLREQSFKVRTCHSECENVGSICLFDSLQVLNQTIGILSQESIGGVRVGFQLPRS